MLARTISSFRDNAIADIVVNVNVGVDADSFPDSVRGTKYLGSSIGHGRLTTTITSRLLRLSLNGCSSFVSCCVDHDVVVNYGVGCVRGKISATTATISVSGANKLAIRGRGNREIALHDNRVDVEGR